MCDNLRSIELKEYTGFKIVAEKNGEYFSVATGIKYKSGKRIRPPKRQRKVSNYFRSGLLEPGCSGFRGDLIGRTTIFKYEHDALDLVDRIRFESDNNFEYSIQAVPATIRDELMEGTYGQDVPIVAGKKITFVEEE